MKTKTASESILPWLRMNLGDCLGILTGSDRRALLAAVQIADLWTYDRNPAVSDAFGLVVGRMQPGARYLAFHSIAHVGDWSFRAELWLAAKLGTPTSTRCKFESA